MNSIPAYNMLIVIFGLVVLGRFSQVFYMNKQTRTLFKILEVSFIQSTYFISIYLYICFSFALTSMVTNLGAYEIYLPEQMLRVFADSMGGLYHPDEGPMEKFGDRAPDWFNFVFL